MDRVKMRFGVLQLVLIIAVLITTAIHLYLGLNFGDVIFVLNAVGYVGLTGLYLLPLKMLQPFRGLVGWVLMGYAALTIVLWAIMNGNLDAPSIAAKLSEIVIIVLLFLDRRNTTTD